MEFSPYMKDLNGMHKSSRVRIHKTSSNVIVLLLDSERDSGEVICMPEELDVADEIWLFVGSSSNFFSGNLIYNRTSIVFMCSCTCFYKIASFLYLPASSGFFLVMTSLLFPTHAVIHLSSLCACSELYTDSKPCKHPIPDV